MSSVLFNRGILTQTGGRRKADEAERVIEALKKSVTDAALTTAEHTTIIKTLQAQVLVLEGKLLVLSEKAPKTPLETEEEEEKVPEPKSSKKR